MRNEKGQFIKGHEVFSNNPFVMGNTVGPRFEKGYTPWNKGKKTGGLTLEARKKVSEALRGRKFTEEQKQLLRKPKLNGALRDWHGDMSAYKALHYRIGKKFGKPDTCEGCDKSGLIGQEIHWANKTGNYTEDREDWLRLCRKCHKEFDLAKAKQKVTV